MLDEIYEGIVVCSSEDWWLVAHLTDLMEMADLLETRSNLGLMVDETDVELREYFVLNYAQSLFSHSSLWEYALFYLSTCPTQGRPWMSEVSSSKDKLYNKNRAHWLTTFVACAPYTYIRRCHCFTITENMRTIPPV
jgi:hypothetical protein